MRLFNTNFYNKDRVKKITTRWMSLKHTVFNQIFRHDGFSVSFMESINANLFGGRLIKTTDTPQLQTVLKITGHIPCHLESTENS